jgi:hypothetical protein
VVCQIGSHTERVVCCQDDNVISHPESDCDVNNFLNIEKISAQYHQVFSCFGVLEILLVDVLKYEKTVLSFFY